MASINDPPWYSTEARERRDHEDRQLQAYFREMLPILVKYYAKIRKELVEFLKENHLRPSDRKSTNPAGILHNLKEALRNRRVKKDFDSYVWAYADSHKSRIERALLSRGEVRTISSGELDIFPYENYEEIYAVYDVTASDIRNYWEANAQLCASPSSKGQYHVVELQFEDVKQWRNVLAEKNLHPAGLRELTSWIALIKKDLYKWKALEKRTVAAPGDVFLNRCCVAKVKPQWSGYMHGSLQREYLFTIDARSIKCPILVREQALNSQK